MAKAPSKISGHGTKIPFPAPNRSAGYNISQQFLLHDILEALFDLLILYLHIYLCFQFTKSIYLFNRKQSYKVNPARLVC